MFGSELVKHLIDELERDYCLCGARLDRDKRLTRAICGIHAKCDELREAFSHAGAIY